MTTVNSKQAQALYNLGYPMEIIGISGLEDFPCSYIAPSEDSKVWANNTGIKHPYLKDVLRWLYSTKGMFLKCVSTIDFHGNVKYRWMLSKTECTEEALYDMVAYDTWDEALSAGINYVIGLIAKSYNKKSYEEKFKEFSEWIFSGQLPTNERFVGLQ